MLCLDQGGPSSLDMLLVCHADFCVHLLRIGSEQILSCLLPGLCSCLMCRTVHLAPQCTGCVGTAGALHDQHACLCQLLARFAGGQHSCKGKHPTSTHCWTPTQLEST